MRTSSGILKHLVTGALLVVFAAACTDSPVASRPTVGALSLDIVSGDAQSARASTELPNPLVVRVTNDRGRPVGDQIVNFRVVSGGGSVYAGSAITNRDGLAQEWWTLGASGAQRLEVRAVDPATGEKKVYGQFAATFVVPPDVFEPNDTQADAFVWWPPFSPNTSRELRASFHSLTDIDWFEFSTSDQGCSLLQLSQFFTVTATLGNVPAGTQYRISLYEGTALRGSAVVPGSNGAVSYSYAGVCSSPDVRTFDVKVEQVSGQLEPQSYILTVRYED